MGRQICRENTLASRVRLRRLGWPRDIWFVVLAVFHVGSATSLQAGSSTNLLVNPGFEEGRTTPEGWAPFSPGGDDLTYTWEMGIAASGDRSVSLSNATPGFGMWQQLVDVAPGCVYRFHAQVGFDDIVPPGYCRLQLVFRDASNAMLDMVDFPRHHGSRAFASDFPHALQVRAPANASYVEVNLFLEGIGTARFDDVYFGPAPVGRIVGTVASRGTALVGAVVQIMGDPWGRGYAATTDEMGQYVIDDVPNSFPRYILTASKAGYRTRSAGKVDVSDQHDTQLDFDLEPGLDPLDDVHVRFGTLALETRGEPNFIPADAVIPTDINGYPEKVHPFLMSDEKIHSDHPDVEALAQSLQATVADPTNTRQVAYAVYTWVSQHIDHDGVFDEGGLENPFTDITSGIWQTLGASRGNDAAWCFGRNFVDWCYSPAELLQVRSGICVEHAMLVSSLLRALNIPARPFSGSQEFYAQTDAEHGAWYAMSTTGGRTSYRQEGRLAPIETFAAGRLTAFPVTSGPMSHEDWDWQTPGMWRETHPWGERYEATSAGLNQAKADMDSFAATGQAPRPEPFPLGDCYQVHYRDITLRLTDMLGEHIIDVRFPLVPDTDMHTPMDEHRYWTNHPECVIDTYIEEVDHLEAVEDSERWFHIVFDVSSLLNGGTTQQFEAFLAHVTQSPGWQTFVTLDNPTGTACQARIQLMDEGSPIESRESVIEAGGSVTLSLEQGDCGRIDHTNAGLIIRASYRHVSDGGIAEFIADDSADTDLVFLLSQHHADFLTWSGLACMNPNENQADVTLEAVDAMGGIVARSEVTIAPMTRVVGTIADLFDGLDFKTVARVQASSNVPICGIVISGEANARLLFTRAVPR